MHTLDDQSLRDLLPRLRRFALSLTRSTSSADDLVQATLEKALSAWSERRAEGDLRAWLFSILYRHFIDGQRRARRYARILSLFGADNLASASPEEIVSARSTLEAFERLPAEQRALLELVSVEGLSYREVAQALDIPMGTVMSRLSRARQALRSLSEGQATTPSLRVLK
ncbi:sigma-70 family RNA polymerase sigma factor [Pseudomonas sp. DTU_2021_1001937_2_SI_NGA_ILE_001]|uniref:sigma-70 family RNA polymerase sigma factor n=1 Tax=Pseudomonas sp. DTU_2021_1001937_2_SI_NGA_ILE_001 TaxID=3077589 RepID=UPI0025EBB537|nr:sigma-70 family RNA polymerase sigma factor [Pseudomonas sp. DTU_2021_1001937_2_SI_NGA_ILE_001]WNW09852.1 sigma-70 family RNA polymerase sigma factor [Pseudomonas sp. DTU_2021_1001937_2_SI_NGA_ILE_001]